ncbi:MAG: pilus assembly protein TadG-related protein, partial [Victivallales bacterium]|nr:pilus assembly protein TadG-related protein [bacterium]MDY5697276.1 pilus assembly protein TadG-related protein [Victivallales bacterium]
MKYTNPTVLSVFAGRCRELVSDSRGAALAITLAFVMPVYLLVIGIYGIGEIVRNKIELQNAADAAAYSASVVQADYLSRIATVNKAMAWTYVDLQKRSLDLAMAVFSEYVFIQFQKDFNMVRQKNSPCCMHVPGVHYNCGTDILVLNPVLWLSGTGAGIPELAREFNGQGMLTRFLLTQIIFTTIAEVSGKGAAANTPKVIKYSIAITKMMSKMNKLREEYPKKVKEVARQIAVANMMEC